MSTWTEHLARSLEDVLTSCQRRALVESLQRDAPTSIRYNPLKRDTQKRISGTPIPWCNEGYYLHSRPNFNHQIDFHQGCYYVQEAASMALSYALAQLSVRPERVLDLCAAPGGKSTILLDVWPDAMLVCNEVDGQRARILEENLSKWGHANVLLSRKSAKVMQTLPEYFDVILVDAPCSGEGMLRKSEAARQQYGPRLIEQCVRVQDDILSAILPALRSGGILVYSTCTWNTSENETQFINRLDELDPIRIQFSDTWCIDERDTNGIYTYRFFPHRFLGEGLSLSIFRKTSEPRFANKSSAGTNFKRHALKPHHDNPVSGARAVHLSADDIGLVSEAHFEEYSLLHKVMGCQPLIRLGTLDKGGKVRPHISLAQQMSWKIPFRDCEVDDELSRAYLQRQSLPCLGQVGEWVRLTHNQIPLGWIKSLSNRSNNYYPKARMMK